MKNRSRYYPRVLQNINQKVQFYTIEILQFLIFGLILIFLLAPVIVCIVVSFNPYHVVFPPEGFSLRWYLEIFNSKDLIYSTYVSFLVASLASIVSTFIAILSSIALVRYKFPGRDIINLFFLSPVLVPAILLALSLQQLFFILGIPKNLTVLLIAHILIVIPFPIRTIMAVLHRFDCSLEEAATNIGANAIHTFIKITLPLIKPGIIAGFMYAFIMSWNNFVMSIFLASPKYITLPVKIAGYIVDEYKPLLAAISTMIIFISALGLIIFDKTIGVSSLYSSK